MSWLDSFLTSYSTVEGNGSALPQRSILDFASGFAVSDDATLRRTIVALAASATLVTPITQGLVEYDQLGLPAAPNVKVFTSPFSTRTVGATPQIVINPDANHAALFDSNGIVLDDNTVTEFEFEIAGTDVTGGAAVGNVGTWKMSMGWERHAAGAPNPLRTATLQTDTSGTNGPGAAPASWGTPTISAVSAAGKYYGAIEVTGGSGATTIDWTCLVQWKKTT